MRKAKTAALCGMTVALSFVLLLGTTVLPVLLYVMPILTGFLVLLIGDAAGWGSALSVYFATSLLSLLFLTEKEAALTYVLFFGWYPLAKEPFDKLPKAAAILLKTVAFNVSAVGTELLAAFVFGVPMDDGLGRYTGLILLLLANVVFWLSDYLLGRYRTLMRRASMRLRKRFRL